MYFTSVCCFVINPILIVTCKTDICSWLHWFTGFGLVRCWPLFYFFYSMSVGAFCPGLLLVGEFWSFSCLCPQHFSEAFWVCERARLLPLLVESSPGWSCCRSCKSDFLLNCWLNFSGFGSLGWLSWKLKKYQVKNVLLWICECFPTHLTAVVGFEKLQ